MTNPEPLEQSSKDRPLLQVVTEELRGQLVPVNKPGNIDDCANICSGGGSNCMMLCIKYVSIN